MQETRDEQVCKRKHARLEYETQEKMGMVARSRVSGGR